MWWFFLLPFLVPFGWMLYSMVKRPKVCPDCGQPLPFFQSPFTKTKRQWIEGGYVCLNCGCETDIAGRKVAPGTLPKQQSVVLIGFSLLALVVMPFLFLIMALLKR